MSEAIEEKDTQEIGEAEEAISETERIKAILEARLYRVTELPESNEYLIEKRATEDSPAQSIKFPKIQRDLFIMLPEDFQEAQYFIAELEAEKRENEIYGNSIESRVGYDSLLRILHKQFAMRVTYYKEQGVSAEESRKRAYRQGITDEEAIKLLDELLRYPADRISYYSLMELWENSPVMSQNLWEMIKREAGREFESGHRAAAAFEPIDSVTDAWNRASFLGIRESFCAEWDPKGGIESSLIDSLTQSWLLVQYWTEEHLKRAQTQPRREHPDFVRWKEWNGDKNAQYWSNGHWNAPTVSEQDAITHAAQMIDRFHRMYTRTLRALREHRRYAPPVTINNPQQVNIAGEGGKQINVSGNAALPGKINDSGTVSGKTIQVKKRSGANENV